MARVLRRGTVWVFQEGEQKKVQGERGSGHSARDEKGDKRGKHDRPLGHPL